MLFGMSMKRVTITVPDDVSLRKVDLSIELQILSFYEQRKSVLESVGAPRRLAS